MIDSYADFHRQYVCIVRQLRTKPGPSASEELRLASELFALTDAHPNIWRECVEEWLASE